MIPGSGPLPLSPSQAGTLLALSLAPVAGHPENSPECMHKDSMESGEAFLGLFWRKEIRYSILTCTKPPLKQGSTLKASSGRPHCEDLVPKICRELKKSRASWG